MMFTSIQGLDAMTPDFPLKQLNVSLKVAAKVNLFKRKLLKGYDTGVFQKKGNGIKSIMEKVGRLNDLSGLFVIRSSAGELLILGSSKTVLIEIQKLTRARRKKDRDALEQLAKFFGFSHYTMGQELLLGTYVNWLEITDKSLRSLIKRAMYSHVKLVV